MNPNVGLLRLFPGITAHTVSIELPDKRSLNLIIWAKWWPDMDHHLSSVNYRRKNSMTVENLQFNMLIFLQETGNDVISGHFISESFYYMLKSRIYKEMGMGNFMKMVGVSVGGGGAGRTLLFVFLFEC